MTSLRRDCLTNNPSDITSLYRYCLTRAKAYETRASSGRQQALLRVMEEEDVCADGTVDLTIKALNDDPSDMKKFLHLLYQEFG